jgi:hypothetical protein
MEQKIKIVVHVIRYWGTLIKGLIPCALLVGLIGSAQAAKICWVERVVKKNGEIHFFMRPSYRSVVSSITRADGSQISPIRNQDESFVLKDGESAFLSDLPHSACTVKVASVNGVLGLQLAVNFCLPGIGCKSETEFVSAVSAD